MEAEVYKQAYEVSHAQKRAPLKTLFQIREDLAAAYGLAVEFGWEEGVCNHFTHSLGNNDRFLVVPFGLHWSELQPDDLIEVDSRTGQTLPNISDGPTASQSPVQKPSHNYYADGKLPRHSMEPSATAFHLHANIHLQKKEKARCVLHTHAPYCTALTMVEGGELKMVHQNSMRFQDQIAYDYNYNGLILSPEEGQRLADVLGDKTILMMGNHGVLVTGESVALAFNTLYYLERACMHQVLAMSTGKPLRIIDQAVLKEAKAYYPGVEEEYYADYHFNSLKRALERRRADKHHPRLV